MVTLTQLITDELDRALGISEAAFEIRESDPEALENSARREVVKKSRDISEKLRRARREFERQAYDDRSAFSLENMAASFHLFERLERAIPSQGQIDDLTELIEKSLERTPGGIRFQNLKRYLPVTFIGSSIGLATSVLAGLTIAPSYLVPGVMFGYSLRSTLKEWRGDKSPDNVSSANYSAAGGGWLFFANTVLTDNAGFGPESDSHMMFLYLGTILGKATADIFSFHTFLSRGFRNYLSSRRHWFDLSRSSFDNVAKYSIVIGEARRGLKFVRKCVGRGVERAEFDEQIEGLERVLGEYVMGRATLEDIAAARITYTPPEKERQERSYVPRSRVTQQLSYEERKAQEAEEEQRRSRKRGRTVVPEVEHRPEIVASGIEEELVRVDFSPKLRKLYRRGRDTVERYSIVTVLDTVRSKLEANPNQGKKVTNRSGGKHLLENLRASHGIGRDANVRKMHPMGAIRVVYTINGPNITVLEVAGHDREYNRLMDKR